MGTKMIIQDEEDQNIEFKESWNSTELLKWVCGFANAKGGRMYIGVRDDGEVLGLTNSKKLMEDIPNAIVSAFGMYDAEVNLLRDGEKKYIEIVIPKSKVVRDYKGVPYIKIGTTLQTMKGDSFRQSVLSRGNLSWDAYTVDGISVDDLDEESFRIFREEATKANILSGVNLDDRLSIYAEGFKERRSHILVTAQNVSGILGVGVKNLDIGINEYKGADFAVSWNDKAGDFGYGIWANGSYLTSEVIEDGQAYQRYDYLYHKGNMVNQIYGLEFDGFFRDQADIESSPDHTFTEVRPGDIKYKDQNDDGQITSEDIVPLDGTTLPKFTFGFGINLSYRNWEFSADFSGRTGVSVNLLDSPLYKPLVSNGNISDTFLNREITWTPENADRATMPRLTTLANDNNYRNGSLWYTDGSFIKLRNVMLSYTFPKKMIKFSDMKVYLQGTNLFSIDSLGFCDPEQLAANYPSTRAFWVGVKFSF